MKIENTSCHATEHETNSIDLNSETILSINQLNDDGSYHSICAEEGGKAILGSQGVLEIASRDVNTAARCGYLIKADSGEVKVDVDEINVYGDLHIQTSSAPDSTIYVRADKITLGGVPVIYDFPSVAASDTDPYTWASYTQDFAQQGQRLSHSDARAPLSPTARAWHLILAYARNPAFHTPEIYDTTIIPEAPAATLNNEGGDLGAVDCVGGVDSLGAVRSPAFSQEPACETSASITAATDAVADAIASRFDEIALLDECSDLSLSALAAESEAGIKAEYYFPSVAASYTDPYASASSTQDPAQQGPNPSLSGARTSLSPTGRAWHLILAHARNTAFHIPKINDPTFTPEVPAATLNNEGHDLGPVDNFGPVDSFGAVHAPTAPHDPASEASASITAATDAATAANSSTAGAAAAMADAATAANAVASNPDEIAVLNGCSNISLYTLAGESEPGIEKKREAIATTYPDAETDASTVATAAAAMNPAAGHNDDTGAGAGAASEADSAPIATGEVDENPFTIGKLYVGDKGSQGCISIDVAEIFLNARSSVFITTTKGSNDQHIGTTIRSEYLGLDNAQVCIRAGSPEAQVSLEIDSINLDNSSYVEIGQDAQVRCTTGDLSVLNHSVISLAGTLYLDAGVMSVADDTLLASVDPHAQIVLQSSTAINCLGYSVLEISTEALRSYLTGSDAAGEQLQVPLPSHLSTEQSKLAPEILGSPKLDEQHSGIAEPSTTAEQDATAEQAEIAERAETTEYDAIAKQCAASAACDANASASTGTYVNEGSGDEVAYVNAASGSIKLSSAGELRLTDEHIELSDESVFTFGDGSGCIEIDGGTISHKDITISKPLTNASSLIVASHKLTLGSESFDGASPLGIALLKTGDLCLVPNAGSDSYTLRDALVLKPHAPHPSDDDADTDIASESDATASIDEDNTTAPTAAEATAIAAIAPATASATTSTTTANCSAAATPANTDNAISSQADSERSTSTRTESNCHDDAAHSCSDCTCSHADSSCCKSSGADTDVDVDVDGGSGASASEAENCAGDSHVAAQDSSVEESSDAADMASSDTGTANAAEASQDHIHTGVSASVSGKLRVEGGSIVIEMGQYTFSDDVFLCSAPFGNSTTAATAEGVATAIAATDATSASAASTGAAATATTASASMSCSSSGTRCSAEHDPNAVSKLGGELTKPHAALALVSDSASAVFLGKFSATKGGKLSICGGLVDLSQAKSLELDEHAIELRDRACLILNVEQLRQIVGFEIGHHPSDAFSVSAAAVATFAGCASTNTMAIAAAAALAHDNAELACPATDAASAASPSNVVIAATADTAATASTSVSASVTATASAAGAMRAGDSECAGGAGGSECACGAGGCGAGDGEICADWVQAFDSTASTTIYIKGLESVSVAEYKELRKSTGHKGFFSGFSIRGVEVGEKMPYASEDVLQGTPESFYHQTELEIPTSRTVVNKSISYGAIKRLSIGSFSIKAEDDEEVMVRLTNPSSNTYGSFAYIPTGSPTGVQFSGKGSHLRLIGDGQIGKIQDFTPISLTEWHIFKKQYRRTRLATKQTLNHSRLIAEFRPRGVLEIGDPHKYGSAHVRAYGSIGDSRSPLYELIIGPGSSLHLEPGSIHVLKLTIKQGGRLIFPNGSLFIGADQKVYGKVESKLEVLGELSGGFMTIYQGSNHLIASYGHLNLLGGFPNLNDGASLHHGSDDDEALAAPILDL